MATVSFTRMSEGTREDYELLEREGRSYAAGLPTRLLAVLETMRDAFSGYQITSLDHLLQSATRAERDGADEETIVATLLHDIGDVYAPDNHSEFAAAALRPYVSERTYWVVRHHGIFQLHHYGHRKGLDRNLRDRYRDSPHYQACVAFCERWDQVSFDPAYDSHPLSHFVPMVMRVFARKPFSATDANRSDSTLGI
jgi:predicted HD phosphohydrolase